MSSGRAALFIDGGYLDHVARSCGVYGRIDYEAFFARLSEPKEMLRAYYYHCLPYQSPQPTADEATRFGAMQKFLAAIDRIARSEVRLGTLVQRGSRADGSPVFIQKQVDTLLAIDLVMLSAKHLIDDAVIVTGDSDLLPAIRVAKDEGVMVRLAHGAGQNHPHRELWRLADERIVLSRDWFASNTPLAELPPD